MAKLHIDFSKYPEEVHLAAHAIGLIYKRPYARRGKWYFRPWRNYFNTTYGARDWEGWENLYEKGYADVQPPGKNTKLWRYYLTRAGLDWLGEELGITILDKEA